MIYKIKHLFVSGTSIIYHIIKHLLVSGMNVFTFMLIPFLFALNLYLEVQQTNISLYGLVTVVSFMYLVTLKNVFNGKGDIKISTHLIKLGCCGAMTILGFAVYYQTYGIMSPQGDEVYSAKDTLYFSVVTFTTLGYGDFLPIEFTRSAAAIEGLLGTIFTPLYLSVVIFLISNKEPRQPD